MCRSCGVAATQTEPVTCIVCGANDFEVISREMIEKIAAVEGGLEEETTYDGRKLRWTEEARKGLWTMKNAYQRRRVKARVEKRARMMKLDAITLEFARQVIEDETGAPLQIQLPSAVARPASAAAEASAKTDVSPAEALAMADAQSRLIARDDKNNPLISTFAWTEDAAKRVLRVPAGYMRNKTQERIEELARERAASTIDLGLVEEGIEIGKKMMAEMIASYSAPGAAAETAQPVRPAAPSAPIQDAGRGAGGGYLNEVSPLTRS
jgi:hypothetical protein